MLHRPLAQLLLRTATLLPATLLLAPVAFAAEPPAAPAEAQPAWGKLTTEDGKTSYSLDKPAVVVGSAAPADLVLADPTIAPRHVRFAYQDGVVTVEELGSRYGTLLNGTALKKGKPVRILTKSSLALGAVTLNFEFGTRPALVPPTQAPPKGNGNRKKTAPAKGKAHEPKPNPGK